MTLRVLAMMCVCGGMACAPKSPVKVAVYSTDGYRREATSAGDVVELVGPSQRQSYVVIATIKASSDADYEARSSGLFCEQPDCNLWHEVRQVAAKLGAKAVVFKSREIVPCAVPFTYDAAAVPGVGVAAAVGPHERTCVVLTVDAINTFRDRVDCTQEKFCRTRAPGIP